MRYQELPHSCGAAAVLNAARCFGKRVAERSARALAGTTTDGTSEHGILGALAGVGLKGTVFSSADFRLAIAAVAEPPAILCVQNSQHWVVVAGRTDGGRRWIIVDGARTKENTRENGVRVFDRRGLRRAWVTKAGVYFGILVSRP